MQVIVDVFDADGSLFDLEYSDRSFSIGTIARMPMVRVMAITPVHLAGRKYLIMLPASTASAADKVPSGLKMTGTTVVLYMPEACVALGPRQIVEFADLRWPIQSAEVNEPLRRN